MFESLQADQLHVVGDATLPFGAGQLRQAKADVALDCQPGKDPAFLKDKDAALIGACHGFSIDRDGTAGGREKSSHCIQQRRFSASGGPDQADKFTIRDVEIDIFERSDALAVGMIDHAELLGLQFVAVLRSPPAQSVQETLVFRRPPAKGLDLLKRTHCKIEQEADDADDDHARNAPDRTGCLRCGHRR